MARFPLGCALLLAGCALPPPVSLPGAPLTERQASPHLAISDLHAEVALPPPPPWPRPNREQQLRNLQQAGVPIMTGGHSNTPFHYHAQLQVRYNGKPVSVPADVGIVDDRMYVLHTHDNTGKIHIEDAIGLSYTLGQFFTVWGVPLRDAQVTESGRVVSDPASLVLQDNQQIQVEFNR